MRVYVNKWKQTFLFLINLEHVCIMEIFDCVPEASNSV